MSSNITPAKSEALTEKKEGEKERGTKENTSL